MLAWVLLGGLSLAAGVLGYLGWRRLSREEAALFLQEFTGDLPWAHIDIAGTAWAEEAKPYLPKGPSGVAVRTLAELALSFGR